MRERYFRFKQFGVHHQQSAMKVGVDAVLLGAWANVDNCNSIIDVGCGCGVITLMLAQRTSNDTIITGIDIDSLSVNEAQINSIESKWSNRINIIKENFMSISNLRFDHIISNPPFFDDGIKDVSTNRLQARHTIDNGLSPISLIKKGCELLSENGRISLICPLSWLSELITTAEECNINISRVTYVKGHSEAPIKRILVELSKNIEKCVETTLVLEREHGVPSDEYRELASEYYLKF